MTHLQEKEDDLWKDYGRLIPETRKLGNLKTPQYFGSSGGDWIVHLPKSRWNLGTTAWTAYSTGNVAFCAEFGDQLPIGKQTKKITYWKSRFGSEKSQIQDGIGRNIGKSFSVDAWRKTDYQSVVDHAYANWAAKMEKDYVLKSNPYKWEGDSDKYPGTENLATYKYGDKWMDVPEGTRYRLTFEGFPSGFGGNDACYILVSSTLADKIAKGYIGGYDGSAGDGEVGKLKLFTISEIIEQAGNASHQINEDQSEAEYLVRAGTYPNGGKGGGTYTIPADYWVKVDGNPDYSIEIQVPESEDGKGDGWTKEGIDLTYINNCYSFIFSSCEEAYGNPEYAKRYDLEDIQEAFWKLLETVGNKSTPAVPDLHVTKLNYTVSEEANKLINKSLDYEKFLAEGAKASINDTAAEVIANRKDKQYIFGPYSLDYNYYEDIHYVKYLQITSVEEGTTLSYGEKNDDIKLVLEGAGVRPGDGGSNGMLKEYPRRNQKFFIVVDADKFTEDTKHITFSAGFEYINQSYAHCDSYNAKNNTYRWNNHYLVNNGDELHDMTLAWMVIHAEPFAYGTATYHAETKDEDETVTRDAYWEYKNVKEYFLPGDVTEWRCPVYIPYTQMGEEKVGSNPNDVQRFVVPTPGSGEPGGEHDGDGGSEAAASAGAWREYRIRKISTEQLDITIELGGFVFTDENEGGKESGAYDGKFGAGDKKVPNVIVELVEKGKEDMPIKTMLTLKTPEDLNHNGKDDGECEQEGGYLFTGLNAMKEYAVKFTYNGQYYEPTTYTAPKLNDWRDPTNDEWKNSSNATDDQKEREALNKKFQTIGANGTYNNATVLKTFLKKELKSVIDDFGNFDPDKTGGTAEMRNYVKACQITAYTGFQAGGGKKYDYYPYPDEFVINIDKDKYNATRTIFRDKCRALLGGYLSKADDIPELYPAARYINLGLHPRKQSDMALKNDVYQVDLEINGEKHKYTYDTLEKEIQTDENWTIGVKIDDKTTGDRSYDREIYQEDYDYKISMYGSPGEYGKTEDDELNIYVTYKITVRNQSPSIETRLDEIVDYYDETLEWDESLQDRCWISFSGSKLPMTISRTSKYSNSGTSYEGNSAIYLSGYDEYLKAGEQVYYYICFKVKKDGNRDLIIDDLTARAHKSDDKGKINVAEINGYSTIYRAGTKVPNIGNVGGKPAGIVDRDSTPGNLTAGATTETLISGPIFTPGLEGPDAHISSSLGATSEVLALTDGDITETVTSKFEDDTDKAPYLRIIFHKAGPRHISGDVFEDIRNTPVGNAMIGNGIKDGEDIPINGVTVQLVEIMKNGKEFIWDTRASAGGAYELGKGGAILNGMIPGKYVVRFMYGNTMATLAPISLGGSNEKSYNGQDYKSTTYQKGLSQDTSYDWKEKPTYNLGDEIEGALIVTVNGYKDVENQNEALNNGKAGLNGSKGYYYDIPTGDSADNVSDAKDLYYSVDYGNRDKVINYSKENVTNYLAEILASADKEYKLEEFSTNDRNTLLAALMENTKMTSETGLIVVKYEYNSDDNSLENKPKEDYHIANLNLGLEERPKAQLVLEKKVKNAKLTLADGSTLFDAKKAASNVLWKDNKEYVINKVNNMLVNIERIRNDNANRLGLIQLTIDKELMHGALIRLDYDLTVKNVGETDYDGKAFYYTGVQSGNVVKTSADQVIDYVANNLIFSATENKQYWEQIREDELIKGATETLVNNKLKSEVNNFNTIITSNSFKKELAPDENSGPVPLTLTKTITSENNTDDLQYENITEIVKTSNTAGRRMAFSVVGNQDPSKEPQEIDADKAEIVRILPPFGDSGLPIIILVVAIASMMIIVGGVFFIKKKVIKS